MTVNICGIPHRIIEVEDSPFTEAELHLGEICFSQATITLNKNLSPAIKAEALCHEIVHGILFHLGYDEAFEEKFVQQLGNALSQSFTPKLTEETNEESLL